MKIDKIEIKRIKNLGNYESLTLALTALPTPGKPISEEFDKLTKFLDYKLNETDRHTKYVKYKAELETDALSDKERKSHQAYIERYDVFMEEIEALELDFQNAEA